MAGDVCAAAIAVADDATVGDDKETGGEDVVLLCCENVSDLRNEPVDEATSPICRGASNGGKLSIS